MIDFRYDFTFLFQMLKYVFLPVLGIVILTAFIIFIYSKNIKEKDFKRYNYIVDFWTTLLAILIVGSLFAVTIGFSISLTNAIKMYNLVKGHEVIYYLVLCTPLIPLLFLVVYVYRIVKIVLNKPKKEKLIVKEEEVVPTPTEVVEESIEEENEKNIDDESDDLFNTPIVVEEMDEEESEDENVDEEEKNNDIEDNTEDKYQIKIPIIDNDLSEEQEDNIKDEEFEQNEEINEDDSNENKESKDDDIEVL